MPEIDPWLPPESTVVQAGFADAPGHQEKFAGREPFGPGLKVADPPFGA
jgi:hypothetical protein